MQYPDTVIFDIVLRWKFAHLYAVLLVKFLFTLNALLLVKAIFAIHAVLLVKVIFTLTHCSW